MRPASGRGPRRSRSRPPPRPTAPATHTEQVNHIARSRILREQGRDHRHRAGDDGHRREHGQNDPPAVATPLPPRNRVQTGKQCPTIAAVADAYAPASPAIAMPTRPASAPFALSEHDDHEPPGTPHHSDRVEPARVAAPTATDVDLTPGDGSGHEIGGRERPDHVPGNRSEGTSTTSDIDGTLGRDQPAPSLPGNLRRSEPANNQESSSSRGVTSRITRPAARSSLRRSS